MLGVIALDDEVVLVDDLELEQPRHDEVLIAVERCGICLTDIHLMDGTLEFPKPVVCGHEVAGAVEQVGTAVHDLAPGARVVVAARPPCRRCWWCQRGQPQLCRTAQAWATGTRADGTTPLRWQGRPVHLGVGVGGFTERVVAPAIAAIPIGDDVPMDIAAVLGCAVLTGAGAVFNTATVTVGDAVLVVGLGGVGTAAVMAARCAGAALVVGADPRADRRDQARALGADTVIDPADTDLVAATMELTDGIGIDVVIDAVGDAARTVTPSFLATRPGGQLVVAGVPATGAEIRLPGAALVSEERHVSGCFIGSADPERDITRLVDLWRGGRFDLAALVTATATLADLPAIAGTGTTPEGIRTVVEVSAR